MIYQDPPQARPGTGDAATVDPAATSSKPSGCAWQRRSGAGPARDHQRIAGLASASTESRMSSCSFIQRLLRSFLRDRAGVLISCGSRREMHGDARAAVVRCSTSRGISSARCWPPPRSAEGREAAARDPAPARDDIGLRQRRASTSKPCAAAAVAQKIRRLTGVARHGLESTMRSFVLAMTPPVRRRLLDARNAASSGPASITSIYRRTGTDLLPSGAGPAAHAVPAGTGLAAGRRKHDSSPSASALETAAQLACPRLLDAGRPGRFIAQPSFPSASASTRPAPTGSAHWPCR